MAKQLSDVVTVRAGEKGRILNAEGEPVVIYPVEINERAAAVLVWLASREKLKASEYAAKIIADFLQSTLTQLTDGESRELLGMTGES